MAIMSLPIPHALRRGQYSDALLRMNDLAQCFDPAHFCALQAQRIGPDHGETADSLATKTEGQ